MDFKRFIVRLFGLIFVIFVLNSLAMKFHWYFSIWYFDMIMHFLGGAWLGFILFYLLAPKIVSSNLIWKMLLFVLIVGTGWEMFEILINVFITQDQFRLLDTISDLLLDLAGGSFIIFYFFKKMPLINNGAETILEKNNSKV